jgi:putative transposase
MDEYDVARLLMQADAEDVGVVFRDWMRGMARRTVLRVFEAETQALCGALYRPEEGSPCYRSGSAPGMVLHEGRKEEVRRPRVRRRKEDGKTEEVRLSSYEAAQEPGHLEAMLLRALGAGVSTRGQKGVYPDSPSNSKSSVSRLWRREGARMLEEFRARDLRRDDWLVLMLDGVRLANELWAVVALGVAEDGTKHMLDFEIGASENTAVATALCERLAERGFAPKAGCRLLCVFDGAKALRKGARKVWGDPVFQRCLVHKERNLRKYLSKRHWSALAGLMGRLRKVQGARDAREALAELRSFVAGKNAEALASLEEAGEELIALHLLEVPNTLHKNLLSTNIIENTIRNMRGKLGRVTRWREETDQPGRWMALALTETEKGFRKLAGYGDLPWLAQALARKPKAMADAA